MTTVPKKALKTVDKKTKKSLKERYALAIVNCQEHRLRDDKDSLTNAERLRLLHDIYDASLFWTQEVITSGIFAGTGAVTTVLDRVGTQIDRLQEQEQTNEFAGSGITINFLDETKERGEE